MGSRYELRNIARSDPDPNVRIAAVRKLDPMKDEYDLKNIATHDNDPRVRIEAVQVLER